MEAIAHSRFQRISPRKVAQVLDLIRGKRADIALRDLLFTAKIAAVLIRKTLQSAIANYGRNTKPELLQVASTWVNTGPGLRRIRARAMGRAAPYRHHT